MYTCRFVLMPWDSWQRRSRACFPDWVFSSQSSLCSATITVFAFGPGEETSGVTFLLFPLALPRHKYQILLFFPPRFKPPSQIACSFCCVLKFSFEMEMLVWTELFLGFNRKKKTARVFRTLAFKRHPSHELCNRSDVIYSGGLSTEQRKQGRKKVQQYQSERLLRMRDRL